MAQSKIIYLGCIVLLLALVEAETPPGIANHPAQASCKDRRYKMCYNLVHVCPKFCPDACTVECASCKPICTSGSSGGDTGSSPPPSDSGDDDGQDKGEKGGKGQGDKDDDKGGKGEGGNDKDGKDKGEKGGKGKGDKGNDKGGKGEGGNDKDGKDKGDKDGKGKGDKDDKGKGDEDNHNSPPTNPPPSTPSSPSSPSPTPKPPTPSPPTPSSPSPTPKPPTPSSPPPSDNVASRKRVRCKNKNYGQCYGQQHVCPATCPTSCQVDCVTCKPVCSCDYPGAVCQDPRFIGADGVTFYFHGKKDKNFCLVTDPNLHINAHFIGKRNDNMTRDFTWVQSIGVLFDDHRLFLGARKTSTWDDTKDRLALSFNGEPIFLPETEGFKWQSSTIPSITITRASSANSVIVQVEGKLKITANVVPITEEESRVHNYDITEDDCFAHLDLGFRFYSLSKNVEGVLGKTYRDDYVSRVKMGISMPVMGGDREYASSSLFTTDCLASRFNGVQEERNSIEEFARVE